MKILKTPKLPKNNKFKKIDSKLSLKIELIGSIVRNLQTTVI